MSPTAGPVQSAGAIGRDLEDPVAQVCHKLRTPLTAAHGFLQLALRDARRSGRDGTTEQLEMVDEQLRRMAAMLDELASQATRRCP